MSLLQKYSEGAKWREAIGHALGYAMMTGKRAGIVLIVQSEQDERHLEKLNAVIRHYGLPIDVWRIRGSLSAEN